jgi:hypothetical protein
MKKWSEISANGDGLTYECDRMDVLHALFYFKHKQKEWHHATNLKTERSKFKDRISPHSCKHGGDLYVRIDKTTLGN